MITGHAQDLSKASVLIQRTSPPWFKWIGRDDAASLFFASYCGVLGVKLVVRHAGLDSMNWKAESTLDPWGLALRFVNDCRVQPWYTFADYCETPNEPMPVWEATSDYITFLAECVRLFAEDGKGCIVGNFGTGQGVPPVVPGASDVGVHQYFGDERLWVDSALELYRALPRDVNLWLTEAGYTGAVGTNVPAGQDTAWGWNGRLDAASYADMIQQRDRDLARIFGNRYKGMAVFQAGADPDWAGAFEVLDTDVERLLWPSP